MPLPVVDEVEQAGDEHAVAGDALGALIASVAASGRGRRALDDESALGPDGDDDGVLHRLGLDQAEDLGAVVLQAVGPAQPAAGDRPEPEVHAFDPVRVDELSMAGRGSGSPGTARGVELERQVLAGGAVASRRKKVVRRVARTVPAWPAGSGPRRGR